MTRSITRLAVATEAATVVSSPTAIAAVLGLPDLPKDLGDWLGRLLLMLGLPYPYLVPDERMLPPESIRFFHVDRNWTAALVDGAFSIGRNLSTNDPTPSMALDTAVAPAVHAQTHGRAAGVRAAMLGIAAPAAADGLCGFLLRSRVVGAYPGLGVNAFGGPAWDQPRDILRMERLGPGSTVLLALIAGDVTRIDIHEAPEQLHFGIDSYLLDPATGTVTAGKKVHPFTSGDPVSVDLKTTNDVDFAPLFRPASPRTLRFAAAAAAAKATNSAEMGFVMTEGVGLVSFKGGA